MERPLQHIAETMHKGGLHESLGIKQADKIPASRIEAATHSDNPKTRRQAILAETFAKFAHHRLAGRAAHHPHSRSTAHGGEA